jgi:hypothetical protein
MAARDDNGRFILCHCRKNSRPRPIAPGLARCVKHVRPGYTHVSGRIAFALLHLPPAYHNTGHALRKFAHEYTGLRG